MPEPILFVVDDDPDALASVTAALERRFGADYRILSDVCPDAALSRLGRACEEGHPVALVLAGVSSAEMTACDWLARVHELCPRASAAPSSATATAPPTRSCATPWRWARSIPIC